MPLCLCGILPSRRTLTSLKAYSAKGHDLSRRITFLGSRDVSQPCCLNLFCNLSKNAETKQRLLFLYKVVTGQFPAIPAEDYITPFRKKRPIRSRSIKDYNCVQELEHCSAVFKKQLALLSD